jgi:RNA polymerase primary sigma factor
VITPREPAEHARLLREAHALEAQARALLPAAALAEALHHRAPQRAGTSTRGPAAEALRDVARAMAAGSADERKIAGRALALLAQADARYWTVALAWERFGYGLARKYRPGDETAGQWAMIGLYNAAVRFDPTAGFSFSTYAIHQVRAVIAREVYGESTPVHVSHGVRWDLHILARLGHQHAEWADAEILAHTGWTPARLTMLREAALSSAAATSLHAPVGLGDDALHEILIDPDARGTDEAAGALEARRITSEVLAELTEREAFVLRHRFGLDGLAPHTIAEVGELLGVSRQRVQQIEVVALRAAQDVLARTPEMKTRRRSRWPNPQLSEASNG